MSVYDNLIASFAPTAWWKLADVEGASSAADSSGNGHAGTPAETVFGAHGPVVGDSAATFVGGASTVATAVSNAFTATAFTVVGWYSTTHVYEGPGEHTSATIINGGSGYNDRGFQIGCWNGVLNFGFGNGTGWTQNSSEPVANDGLWHQIAVTYGAGIGCCYHDGTLIDRFEYLIAAGEGNFRISGGDREGFTGSIAQVAIMGVALSATQIETLWLVRSSVRPLGAQVRERHPLRLSARVETPGGASFRHGQDDPNAANVPSNLTLSSAMPGGHERCSYTLERDPRIAYPDLQELSRLTVEGVGGEVAWQGRLEKLPDVSGDQAQVTPEGVGYQAALEDDQSAREIYVDGELSKWTGPSVARKIELLQGGGYAGVGAPTVGMSASGPALITALTGAWSETTRCEGWYDARGIKIGWFGAAWRIVKEGEIAGGSNPATDEKWFWSLQLAETPDINIWTASPNLRTSWQGSWNLENAEGKYAAATVILQYTGAGGGAGVEYPLFWTTLKVFGEHGLTRQGAFGPDYGLLASDVVGHAIGKWAPEISFSVGSEGTIKPTGFVIPQLVFLEPTTVAEIIKQATRFELPDWAVWEGPPPYRNPTFYMNPKGERGKNWRARIGPSKLQEAGPQVGRLWNGVVVSYTDAAGVSRMVGPPGFAGGEEATEDSTLRDTDPENPLNELGIKKWALLKMGTTSVEGAKAVGRIFLQEQKTLESSGQAALTGHVEDDSGILWPAWKVRAGDRISFVDARYGGQRTIVKAEYADATKTCTISLGAPPEALTALLERLSVSIVNV